MQKVSEEALEKARDGLRHLSPTQVRILEFVVDGRSSAEIGKALESSPRTVEVHRRYILTKCGAENMIALARLVGALENDPVMSELGSLSVQGRARRPAVANETTD